MNKDKFPINELQHGWIKLYRSFQPWLKNHKLTIFWLYCLLKASYTHTKLFVGNQQVNLSPGEFVFGRKKAAEDCNMSEQQIRTCIAHLKNLKNITIKTTNKYSVITIMNWGFYQDGPDKATNKTTCNQPAPNHIQEYKNKKKKKNESTPSELPSGKNDSKINRLREFFISLCREKEIEAIIEEGKDEGAIRRVLSLKSEEQIKNIFDWFVTTSPKAQEYGFKISVALSSHTISEYDKKGRWLYEG